MRGGTGRLLIVTAYAVVVGLLVPVVPAAHAAPLTTVQGCRQDAGSQPSGNKKITDVPAAQQRFAVERLQPLADGAGVTVAVIDSGVDDDHPQLRGQVLQGRDYLHGRRDGRQDCNGHGTGVAGIIGANPSAGVAFRGLAPRAGILPIRVSEQLYKDDKPTGDPGDVRELAEAITWAAGQGADVINLSLTVDQPDEGLRKAVAGAVDDGVVIVAAVGNRETAADRGTPYPAALPGVLGVGAVGATGQREGYSQQGEFVDVMAPGAAVIAPAAGGGHVRENGTSFAAPFVSATAALIMQRFPGMRGQDVIRQITATADPAPGGRRSDAYGFGVLNPYRALTETVTTGAPKRALVLPVATADPAIAALRQRRAESRATAFRVAGAGLAVTVVVVLVALIVPNGRRRRWAPAGYRVR